MYAAYLCHPTVGVIFSFLVFVKYFEFLLETKKILPGILIHFFKYVSLIKTLKRLEMEPMAPEK